MEELTPRLRAVCDLHLADVREMGGRHEYDGKIQDLSPDGVRSGLAGVEQARANDRTLEDRHDEAHLTAFENLVRVEFGQLELHRRNPLLHLGELDLACYDRDYAPAGQRAAARLTHLAAWPQAVDNAIAALDQVSGPVAEALLGAARGLVTGIPDEADAATRDAALAAHARLVTHLERVAEADSAGTGLGTAALTALMGSAEAMQLDIGTLAGQADAERDRLRERLAESCARIDPDRAPLDVARELVREHPDAAGVIEAAQTWTMRAIEFTRDRDLMPYNDGECLVGLAPPSRRWAMAMMSSNSPDEPEGPSWYHITPPEDSWPAHEIEEWLEVFSDTTLPGITVHEVAPGHFSHGRALRRAPTPVRRVLQSMAFVEGWAHYAEELCVEEGFCAPDPRFEIGVWLEALVRVTRLACAIGVHTAGMTVQEGARRFEADTHLLGAAALSEARRATFDPTYGRYTWGKLVIMNLREKARKDWGMGFTLRRFHTALMDLGAPPLGLLETAIERG
ncbi:MAG TPA: DUF885 family protein [Streptosporangiaceae bacterium]|jgi:hypothetical protein